MKQPDQATAHDRCCICFHDMALRLMQYPDQRQADQQAAPQSQSKQAGWKLFSSSISLKSFCVGHAFGQTPIKVSRYECI